ncbi:recombination mediator RecR [Alloalcanivorax xenomutans]|uniref:Recombination protein RecR n=1 Tax=Alloalcanivorax xenomutans TaxID=1094342 RepID=A0A9Q3W3E1_9GAMM|nr:recombination mediator RecR [Alloalcanivorax xenomutans]ARB46367.1 recombination protein RecR [Alloalcanivorax xenomutans]KYZ87716.1 recombination protein RecR [Alcanivorax sp. KX64203]MCE7507816.1 recombination mediator RecR [Alloalcanivorax xenomutans]MCE7521488.1 recombination mediator RecR [Alloalcanivorax xenomutans]
MKHPPLVETLIEAFTCLPGVGPRSAQRMTYALLERGREQGRELAGALQAAMDGVSHCERCRNYAERTNAEQNLCAICLDPRRDSSLICIVSSPANVLAVEQSGEFRGHYFVLMGELSPLDGVGPRELGLDVLEQRLRDGEIRELILATGTTVEGEATAHYILDLAREAGVSVTRIAQGVPMGGDLEFVDGATLAQALRARRPFAD